MNKADYANAPAVAVYNCGLLVLEVIAIVYDINDFVVYRWAGETNVHKSKIIYNRDSRAYFHADSLKVPLDECVRVNA